MKLNERNIDDWLHQNLNDASSGTATGMLEEILQTQELLIMAQEPLP